MRVCDVLSSVILYGFTEAFDVLINGLRISNQLSFLLERPDHDCSFL